MLCKRRRMSTAPTGRGASGQAAPLRNECGNIWALAFSTAAEAATAWPMEWVNRWCDAAHAASQPVRCVEGYGQLLALWRRLTLATATDWMAVAGMGQEHFWEQLKDTGALCRCASLPEAQGMAGEMWERSQALGRQGALAVMRARVRWAEACSGCWVQGEGAGSEEEERTR